MFIKHGPLEEIVEELPLCLLRATDHENCLFSEEKEELDHATRLLATAN